MCTRYTPTVSVIWCRAGAAELFKNSCLLWTKQSGEMIVKTVKLWQLNSVQKLQINLMNLKWPLSHYQIFYTLISYCYYSYIHFNYFGGMQDVVSLSFCLNIITMKYYTAAVKSKVCTFGYNQLKVKQGNVSASISSHSLPHWLTVLRGGRRCSNRIAWHQAPSWLLTLFANAKQLEWPSRVHSAWQILFGNNELWFMVMWLLSVRSCCCNNDIM